MKALLNYSELKKPVTQWAINNSLDEKSMLDHYPDECIMLLDISRMADKDGITRCIQIDADESTGVVRAVGVAHCGLDGARGSGPVKAYHTESIVIDSGNVKLALDRIRNLLGEVAEGALRPIQLHAALRTDE